MTGRRRLLPALCAAVTVLAGAAPLVVGPTRVAAPMRVLATTAAPDRPAPITAHAEVAAAGAPDATPAAPDVPAASADAASSIDFVRSTELPLTMETLPGTPGSGYVFVHGFAQADLNGDDALDVVVAVDRYSGATPSSYAAVLLGAGDGTFADPVSYPAPLSSPASPMTGVAVGDFDGDGDPDVAGSNPERREVLFYANDGAGVLSEAVFTPTGDSVRPDALTAVDLDDDGADDLLALAPDDDAVAVLESAADGTFGPPTILATGDLPRTVAVGDFDGAAGPDIAVATETTHVVSVFLSEGGFSFGPRADISLYGGALFPIHVWSAELTGDDHVDLAVTGENHGVVGGTGPSCRACLVTLAGAGDGTFAPVANDRWAAIDRVSLFGSGNNHAYYPGPAGDLDGDGVADVAIAHDYDAAVTTALGDGSGGWSTSQWAARHGEAGTTPPDNTNFGPERPTTWLGRGAFIGDHDGDGRADVLAAGDVVRFALGGVALLRGDPAAPGRLLAPELPRTDSGTLAGALSVAAADWTGDATPDVLFSDGTALRFVANQGNATFGPPTTIPMPGRVCDQVGAGDLDSDGNVDVVCWKSLSRPDPFVLYGDGAGGVDELVDTTGAAASAAPPSTMAMADVDADGDDDLVYVATLASDRAVFVQRNGGPDRTWSHTATIPLGAGSTIPVTAGDINGDGAADIVARCNLDAAGHAADRLLVAISNGDGTFGAPTETASGTGAVAFNTNRSTLADLDGDDLLDLVLIEQTRFGAGGGFVYTARGRGDGTFDAAVAFPASPLGDVAVDDLDGDDDLDVIVGSYGFGLEVLPGNGDGTLAEPRRFGSAGSRIDAVAVADLDGDGRTDVVAGRQSGNQMNPPGPVLAIHRNAGGEVPPAELADLQVTSVSAPASVAAGADALLGYGVTNAGGDLPAAARWTDTVWLSQDATWDVGDRLVDRTDRSGPLAAGAAYAGSITAPLLPLNDGEHHLIVRTDSRHQVPEPDEADNDAVQPVTVEIPDLLADGDALEVTLVAGRDSFAAVPVEAGQALLLTLDGPGGGLATVEAVRDKVPGPAVDRSMPDVDAGHRAVLLPAGGAGVWFVRLHGLDGAGAGTLVSLAAESADFALVSASPGQGSNAGSATVTLRGTGLDDAVRATLVGETTEVAATLAVVDAETVRATFPLEGQPVGHYDVVVDGEGDRQSTLPAGFEVTDDPAGHLELYLLAPPSVRGGWPGTLQVTVRNTGATDVGVDAVRISGNGAGLRLDTADDGPFSTEPIVLLPGDPPTAVGPVPAGAIPPGGFRRALIAFQPGAGGAAFDVEVFPSPSPAATVVPPGLVIEAVEGPDAVTTGTSATLRWRIRNAGGAALTGPWTLFAGLAGDGTTLEGTLVEIPSMPTLARLSVGAGATLAPGGTLDAEALVPVDLALDAAYRWVVRHEAADPVFLEHPDDPPDAPDFDVDEADAISWSTAVDVSVPPLAAGATIQGTIEPDGRRLYRVDAAPGAYLVELDLGGEGPVELLAAPGVIPEDAARVLRVVAADDTPVSGGLEVGDETMYLVVDGTGVAAPTAFDLSLAAPPPAIDAIAPPSAGNGGRATLVLRGAGLDAATAVRLVQGATTRDAEVWRVADPFELAATVDLTGLAAGPATIEVERGADGPLAHEFGIVDGSGGQLVADVDVPETMRFGAPNPVTVHYANTGVNDLPLPLLTVVANAGGPLSVFPDKVGAGSSPTLVPPPPTAGFPVIPPGATGTVVLWHVPPETATPLSFDVHATSFDDPGLATRPLDWAAFAADLKPDGADDGAWADHIAEERARYGETYGDLGRYIAGRYAELGAAGLRPVFVDGQWLFWPGAPTRPRALRGPAAPVRPAPLAPLGPSSTAVVAQEASGDGVQNVYAVVIGDPQGDLPGARRDAQAMSTLLTDTYNVPADQVRHLERGVTKAQAMNAVTTMRNSPGMDADDLFIVFNAGHGDTPRDDADVIEEADQGYNLMRDDHVSGRDWATALQGSPAPVLFIDDSCRSGLITNGVSQVAGDRVVTLASADYYGKVLDNRSYGQQLITELQRDPRGDFYAAAQRAADAQVKAYDAEYNNNAGTAWATQIRGGSIERQFFDESELIAVRRQAVESGVIGQKEFPQYPTLDRNGVPSLSINPPDPKEPAATQAGDDQEDEPPVDTDTAEGNHGQPTTEPTPDGPDAGEPRSVPAPPTRGRPGDAGPLGIDGGWPGPDCCGPGTGGDSIDGHTFVPVLLSGDPNDIVGPAGAGPQRYVAGDAPFAYQVRFENLGPGSTHNPDNLPLATAPAVLVDVTEQLDPDLDWATFALGSFGVGTGIPGSGYPTVRFDPPPGVTAWSGEELVTVPVFGTATTTPLLVRGAASLDPATGAVRWTVTGVDPATGDIPVDARVGFLPPEDGTGAGQGFADYVVDPDPGLPTGATVDAAATIVFDANPPIDTPTWTNTIDAGPPSAVVTPLAPTTAAAQFTVAWTGTDDGSGVGVFDVFASVDGGPFGPWLTGVTAQSAPYAGAVGHTYAFTVAAVDNVGHREVPTGAVQASTQVVAPPPPAGGGPAPTTPAPASGAFSDIAGNPHQAMIAAIAARGITRGCTPDGAQFCPAASVSRGQMAAFLSRALGLPAAARDHFGDDDGSPFEDAINRVAAAGIARGFTDGTYRPAGAVTRAEMASFLARAFAVPPAGGNRFVDVSGVHAGAINAIAAAGITLGCTPDGRSFCPDAPVRRDQMASFLGRALGLGS